MSEEGFALPLSRGRGDTNGTLCRPARWRRRPVRSGARLAAALACIAGLAMTLSACLGSDRGGGGELVGGRGLGAPNNPDVAVVDGGLVGEATITWETADAVYAQVVDGEGLVAEPVRISSPKNAAMGDARDPVVGVDGEGDAVIAYLQHKDGEEQVFVRRLGADGELGDPLEVSAQDTGETAPALAVDNEGYATVTWVADGEIVRARRVTPDNELSELFHLEMPGAQTPEIGVDDAGVATLAWNVGWGVWAARLSPGGEPEVEDAISLGGAENAQLAVSGDGTATVVSSGDDLVFLRQLDAGGRLWPEEEPLRLGDPGPEREATVTATDDVGEVLVTWISTREIGGVDHDIQRAARVPFGAGKVSADFELSPPRPSASQGLSETAVTSDGSGRAAIVWRRQTGPGTHVLEARAMLLDNRLEPADGPADVTNPDDPAARPIIVAGPNGTVTGVWLGSGGLRYARFIPPAECSDGVVDVPHNTPTEIPLACTGLVDSRRVTQEPENGTVGPVDGDAVTYTPAPGFAGEDLLTFVGVNKGGDSAPATVTLRVAAPPSAPDPQPGPANDPGAQTAGSPAPSAPVAAGDRPGTPADTPVSPGPSREAQAHIVSRRVAVLVRRRDAIRRPLALTGRALRGIGIARVRIRCTGAAGAICRGRLTLHAGRARLGSNAFAIRAGRARAVGIRLSRAAAKALAARGRMRVTARATTRRTAGAASRATRRTLVLRAVRR